MLIVSSEFLVSNQDIKKCPSDNLPEYAFIGRSNVGKSSLINMLCKHNIAKVSGTPGKTQLINHFIINKQWYLVDLPGYGYARVSKSTKEKFQSIVTDYVLKRQQLTCLFVLVDIRHEPQKIDLEFMRMLGEEGVPFAIVFTKADKLKPSEIEQNTKQYKNIMLQEWHEMPMSFITSSAKEMGKNELLDYIDSINAQLASYTTKK